METSTTSSYIDPQMSLLPERNPIVFLKTIACDPTCPVVACLPRPDLPLGCHCVPFSSRPAMQTWLNCCWPAATTSEWTLPDSHDQCTHKQKWPAGYLGSRKGATPFLLHCSPLAMASHWSSFTAPGRIQLSRLSLLLTKSCVVLDSDNYCATGSV